MFFPADPDYIVTLDSVQLVKLMKRLMLAECRLSGIPLRSAAAPLQVTVADGGEDGRVKWDGGAEATDYLPHRFCIFQSKAQNLTDGTIADEVLVRAKDKPVRLNDALQEVLDQGAAYIVFCSHAFTEKKKGKLVTALKAAIKVAGQDASRAAAIKVYDANAIADWVNSHPSVALWLASLQRQRSLSGFLSREGWSEFADIAGVPWVNSDAARYVPVNFEISKDQRVDKDINAWTFAQAQTHCRERLAKDSAIIRIAGPSGFGKSRFAYEIVSSTGTLADEADSTSVIYADCAILSDEVAKLALEIADSGSSTIMVCDECSDTLHAKLAAIAGRGRSRLKLLTIDTETKIVLAENTLTLRVERADKDMLKVMAKTLMTTTSSLSPNWPMAFRGWRF